MLHNGGLILDHQTRAHLYAQAARLPLLADGTLSAGPTEHIGTNFALALQLLSDTEIANTLVAAFTH